MLHFTTIHSSPEVKAAGLPVAVRRINPPDLVAAFRTEEDAVAYCQLLNSPDNFKDDYEALQRRVEFLECEKRRLEDMYRPPEACDPSEEPECEPCKYPKETESEHLVEGSELDKALNAVTDNVEEKMRAARETAARIKAEILAKQGFKK